MAKSERQAHVAALCQALGLPVARGRAAARFADELFAQSAHVHGLTKTVRPLVGYCAALCSDGALSHATIEAAAQYFQEADSPLCPDERRLLHAALEVFPTTRATPTDASPDARHQVARRIAAVARVACLLARPGVRAVGVRDDGNQLDILASTPRRGPIPHWRHATLLWDAVCPRPIGSVRACEGKPPGTGLLHPCATVAECVRRIGQRQLEQFLSRTYGLEYDRDIEFVHEMRVALRRLRAALQTFRKALDGKAQALRDELKWLGAELGEVRDLDVFLAFLRGHAEAAVPSHQPFLQRLVQAMGRQRRQHYRRLLEAFASERFEALATTYLPMARRAPGTENALVPCRRRGARSIASLAPDLLHQRLDRVLQYGRRLSALDSDELHSLRIDCKRLRYAAEFLADLYPGQCSGVVGPMVYMQDALGDVHDADVYRERIEAFARRSRQAMAEPRSAAAPQALIAHLERWRDESLQTAAATWSRFTGSRSQQHVVQIIDAPRRVPVGGSRSHRTQSKRTTRQEKAMSKSRTKELYVGVDVGGTKILAALADASGTLLARDRRATPRDITPEETLEAVFDTVAGALDAGGVAASRLTGIGLSIPGVVDAEAGHVVVTPNMNLTGLEVVPPAQKRFGVPIALGNDVNVGTLGEKWLGAARHASSAVGIFVGTGIGGGVIVDGKLVCGSREGAGEVGHIVMEMGGPLCGCGNRGCLEALASRTAIERDLRAALADGRESIVAELLEDSGDLMKSKVLKRALKAKDPLVTEVMQRAAEILGYACLTVRHLLDPDVIVLGGGVMEACGSFILPIVRQIVAADALAGARPGGYIAEAELGDDAVVLGAVALALQASGHDPLAQEVPPPDYPAITGMALGQVTVGDTTFETDILIRGDGSVKKRKKKATDKKPHTIDADELERLCKGGPRLVVIGTGHSGEATLTPEAALSLQERRIECQMLPTPEAADAFNQATGRKAALLHVTC
ncbi:ROK family protein [bacterium]|nr:ROK family protein [bacterium]